MTDFAKIVRLNDGTQALFFFEFDDEEQILNQIFQFDGCHANVKLGGLIITEQRQQEMLDGFTPEEVMQVKREIGERFGFLVKEATDDEG